VGPYRQANLPDVNEQLLEGYQTADKHFRVHLDGYNQLLYLSGEVDESPRHEFFYYGERDLLPTPTTTGKEICSQRHKLYAV